MQFWNQTDWRCQVLTNAFATGSGFALSPDGTRVACHYTQSDESGAVAQTRIEVWDVSPGAKRQIEGTPNTLSLSISPDGKWLAFGNRLGGVSVWNLSAWVPVNKFQPHQGLVHGLAFSPDSKRLATGGSDQRIHIWEAGTTNKLSTPQRRMALT